jgi:hypothetical protein
MNSGRIRDFNCGFFSVRGKGIDLRISFNPEPTATARGAVAVGSGLNERGLPAQKVKSQPQRATGTLTFAVLDVARRHQL